MLIYKTYKFRMYPNDIQKEKITLFFKARRFIYNKYLYDLKIFKQKKKQIHYILLKIFKMILLNLNKIILG